MTAPDDREDDMAETQGGAQDGATVPGTLNVLQNWSPDEDGATTTAGEYGKTADLTFGQKVVATCPDAPNFTRCSLCAELRVVKDATAAGIRQILDLGCGAPVPGIGVVHEVARSVASDVRTVYVDIDPVAASTMAMHIAPGDTNTIVLQATDDHPVVDIRDPDKLLPRVEEHLDFTQPVLVILGLVVHLIPDDHELGQLLPRYWSPLAEGSRMMLSVPTVDTTSVLQQQMKDLVTLYKQEIGVDWNLRNVAGLQGLLERLAGRGPVDIVVPGDLHPTLEPTFSAPPDDPDLFDRWRNALVVAELERR